MKELKEEVLSMKREVKQMQEEEKSLALELLSESKKQHKRDFIEKIVLIIILIISNLAWILYINQFDFTSETVEQSVDSTNNSTITQNIE